MPNDHIFQSLHVEAFRGLRDFRLDGLGGVNVLVGPNNSGKSSVLESLTLLARPLDMRQWVTILRARDPGRIAENRLISLRWCFPQFDSPPQAIGEDADDSYLYEGDVRIFAYGAFPVRELHVRCQEVFGELSEEQIERHRRRFGDVYEDSTGAFRRGAKLSADVQFDGSPYKATEEMVFWEGEPFFGQRKAQEQAVRVELLTATTYSEASPFIRQVHRLQFGKYHPAAVEILREFDPRVRGFAIGSSRSARPTVYVDHERFGAMPLTAFGDGMRRALSLVVAATAAEGGILLIDEIEDGIHFSALEKMFPILLRTCKEFNVQLFVTTQSLGVVDAIVGTEGQSLDDLVAFRLPAPNSNQRLARFPGPDLYGIRYESGLEVR